MKPKFIIILNLLLGAALLGGVTLHPYTVSAETAEIETDSDDLEGVENMTMPIRTAYYWILISFRTNMTASIMMPH